MTAVCHGRSQTFAVMFPAKPDLTGVSSTWAVAIFRDCDFMVGFVGDLRPEKIEMYCSAFDDEVMIHP